MTCDSPHVMAYRLWYREPHGDWVWFSDGQTAERRRNRHSFGPVPPDSRFACWLGIAGAPDTSYRAVVTLEQSGARLMGGEYVADGWTTADGIAEVAAVVRLR